MTKPKAPPPDLNEVMISVGDLCKLSGFSDRSISHFVNIGILKKAGVRNYRLLESVRSLMDHLKTTRKTKSDNEPQKRLTELKITEMELKIKTRNRELVPIDEVREVVSFINALAVREFNMIASQAFPMDLKERARIEAIVDASKDRIAAAMEAALKSGMSLGSTIRGAEARERALASTDIDEEEDDDDEY